MNGPVCQNCDLPIYLDGAEGKWRHASTEEQDCAVHKRFSVTKSIAVPFTIE